MPFGSGRAEKSCLDGAWDALEEFGTMAGSEPGSGVHSPSSIYWGATEDLGARG